MNDNLPKRPHVNRSVIADAGAWLSGPCLPQDQYNPSVLVSDVASLLERKGLRLVVDDTTARCAAADLLRSLGVAPASLPTRRD